MRTSDAFPSKYLKVKDISEDIAVTIKNVTIEEFKGDNGQEQKLLLTFRELDKGMICNKTNCKVIEKLYGEETDDWVGKKITLYPAEVQFKDDMVEAIRVRLRPPGGTMFPTDERQPGDE